MTHKQCVFQTFYFISFFSFSCAPKGIVSIKDVDCNELAEVAEKCHKRRAVMFQYSI